MNEYERYLERARREHGDRFDASALASQFVRYFRTGERIKVRTSYGEEITGTVSVTTGWRPAFLLMRRSNAIGSSDLLGERDEVVAIQVGRQYRPMRQTKATR